MCFLTYFLEISEESVTYVSVKFKSSDAPKKLKNRIWKVEGKNL